MTLIRDNTLLRRWQGPLTSDIVLHPGGYGLGQVPAAQVPDQTANTVCGYCSTGCSLKVHLKDGVAINLSANRDYPVNRGMACPKGWEALTPLAATDRACAPMIRDTKTGKLVETDWDTALRMFCARIRSIQEQHGAESVAFLSTGQIVTEEMVLLGILAKFGMGMVHGDGNTRQCMATAVTAYKESFGFDAPPYTYQDFEESDVLVFIGANPCIAHPIMWQRVMENQRNPEIIVIDPRRTETAMAATSHVVIRPKSDLALLYALAHILCREGWIDQGFIDRSTTGFDAFRTFLKDFPPEVVAPMCGLPVQEIEQLAVKLKPGKRVSYWWTMGVNQSHEGTRTAQALINLALMTGNIGKPGTGPNSITGQCNAMGSRLFSNTTSLLGGYSFLDDGHREKIAGILDIPVSKIPRQDSWDYDRIVTGIEKGEIKGLWIVATNPSHSWSHRNRFNRLMDQLDFLVVQDMYSTAETVEHADLLLPAAGWGEKEGTFINSERRVGRVRKVARAPGQALSDFYIFKLIAEYWGCGDIFRNWETPEDVFQVMTRLSKDQPCDISGITGYDMLEQMGGIQWPCPEGLDPPDFQRRLFEDGCFYHPDGKARFIFEPPRETPEATDREYPFTLLTGRGTSAQWHTQTRTAKSKVLRKLYPSACYVEIHPDDARRVGCAGHDRVRIRSRRGSAEAIAFLTPTIQPGQVFMPMHDAVTNCLTCPAVDPYSRQPAYKHSAVAVELT